MKTAVIIGNKQRELTNNDAHLLGPSRPSASARLRASEKRLSHFLACVSWTILKVKHRTHSAELQIRTNCWKRH